jgi:hypothetical protein
MKSQTRSSKQNSKKQKLNDPPQADGVSERRDDYPKGVTPEFINRGSSSGFAWIPDRSIRE